MANNMKSRQSCDWKVLINWNHFAKESGCIAPKEAKTLFAGPMACKTMGQKV